MEHKTKIAICDANILIDFLYVDENIIRQMCGYWQSVYVPDCILAEVEGLDARKATSLGLEIVETPLNVIASQSKILSENDLVCMEYIVQHNMIGITNDKPLRNECIRAGAIMIWGLEMLVCLVENKQYTKQEAKIAAEKIQESNPRISLQVLNDFYKKLEEV